MKNSMLPLRQTGAITARLLLKRSSQLLRTGLNRPAPISGVAADVICKWLMIPISNHSGRQWLQSFSLELILFPNSRRFLLQALHGNIETDFNSIRIKTEQSECTGLQATWWFPCMTVPLQFLLCVVFCSRTNCKSFFPVVER